MNPLLQNPRVIFVTFCKPRCIEHPRRRRKLQFSAIGPEI